MSQSFRIMKSCLSFTHLINVVLLARLAQVSVIPNDESVKAGLSPYAKKDNPSWPWGVIGDSWESGVSYNNSVLFGNNLDNCLRT